MSKTIDEYHDLGIVLAGSPRSTEFIRQSGKLLPEELGLCVVVPDSQQEVQACRIARLHETMMRVDSDRGAMLRRAVFGQECDV